MSLPLFKLLLKKNWTILAGVTAFVLMEIVVCIFMFEDIAGMDFMNFGGDEILPFTASVLAMVGVMYPLAFFVFMVSRIAYKPIDSTSLSAHLSAGMKRTTFLVTTAIFLVTCLMVIFISVFVVGGVCMLYWDSINWAVWAYVVFSILMANVAVSAVSFMFAIIFAPSNLAKLGMIALPALLFVFAMLTSYVSAFRWASVFMWVDISAETVMAHDFSLWWLWNLLYLVIAVGAYVISYFAFRKRQLAI